MCKFPLNRLNVYAFFTKLDVVVVEITINRILILYSYYFHRRILIFVIVFLLYSLITFFESSIYIIPRNRLFY